MPRKRYLKHEMYALTDRMLSGCGQNSGTDSPTRWIRRSLVCWRMLEENVPPSGDEQAPQHWVCALVLLFLVILAYRPALSCDFIWDDDQYVYENPVLTSDTGLRDIWLDPLATPQYYPVVHTSYWLEHKLWGMRPLGYHSTNLLLHGAAAILLYLLLLQLKVPGAWWAAALFAIHPVNVESVAWITERKNVLAGLFAFAALNFGWWATESQSRWQSSFWKWLCALLFFVLALLSKTVACSMPAVLLLLLWWRRRLRPGTVAPLIPFFASGLLFALLTVRLERHFVGADGPEWDLSLIDRCLIAGRALWFYISKIAWPEPLMFIYPRWEINSAVWWQYLFPLAALFVLIVGAAQALRGKRGLFACSAMFAGVLVPALGFFNVYPMLFSFVADHFQYLATPVACAGLCAVVFGNASHGRLRRGGMTAVLAVFLVLSILQCRIYQDEETLWRATAADNPTAWIAHNNLGLIQLNRGETTEAIAAFHTALRYRPHHSTAWGNLGLAYSQLGQKSSAASAFRKSVELEPEDADALNLAANFFAGERRYDEALPLYLAALARKDDPGIGTNCAAMLIEAGRWQDAAPRLQTIVQSYPDFPAARYHLAYVSEKLEHHDQALVQLRALASLDPRPENLIWLMRSLIRGEHYQEASPLAEALLNREPSPQVLALAARVAAENGAADIAIQRWERALSVTSPAASTLQDYAWFLATRQSSTLDQRSRALASAQLALKLAKPTTPALLDCVAAAHASVADFAGAELFAARAVAALSPVDARRESFQSRLDLYRAGQSFYR